MKKLLLLILITFAGSADVVLGLYGLSHDIRNTPGSFVRTYPPHPVIERESMSISHSSYYLAGATHDSVYLANRMTPLHILGINKTLTDTVHIFLKLVNIEQHRYNRITVRIDSPNFYFSDGGIPYYYRGPMTTWKGKDQLQDTTFYVDAVPISAGSFAMRTLSTRTQEHVLGRKSLSNGTTVLSHGLLEKQGDGIFSTDGNLLFNSQLSKLVYLYYYRNEFMIMDTLLALEARHHTVDTFRTARVLFDTVRSAGVVKLSAPPLTINKHCTTYGNLLFVHSLAAARNENMPRFREGSVIDVYSLITGRYRFSFYVPSANGKKMKDMLLFGTSLYILYDTKLIRFELLTKVFKFFDTDTIL